ncbi:biopolymer transport protein ExbD [Octadecabacter temperatus]|uniref:Biopolymer transport protein ExbD n=1 Tax=Octadecabacter temperatus TaxID=1458307 RepID=A0A0K0Y625_9RHOB|nr:biopolymer transporter ExbD [Octadecabacter temperatus]AKS46346.1 biopolymer transport protein ExbD [Octadecabacter temperatus]SIO12297.1 biopolymer transport protein ExbD [Octadecabacter temperatus]
MALTKPARRAQSEPTIALINIVFLMLVFFMIAGALAPTLDDETSLIETAELEGRAPPDTVVLRADGTLFLRGAEVTIDQAVEASLDGPNGADLRLVADRAVSARTLMSRVAELREAGAESVWLVTERGLEQ